MAKPRISKRALPKRYAQKDTYLYEHILSTLSKVLTSFETNELDYVIWQLKLLPASAENLDRADENSRLWYITPRWIFNKHTNLA